MLNIQQVTEAIHRYRRDKGILKKLRRSDHPAILATEAHLQSLQRDEVVLFNQDLFTINRFFVHEYPVKPGTAAYAAWYAINYQNFCALNYDQVTRLTQLLSFPVPLKYAGFTTCAKAGYQQFPTHFSKLTREHLDKKSNTEKMQKYFQVLSKAYQQSSFSDDHFLAFSKLCVEGMLNQDYIDIIQKSSQANFLAKCLIRMKHTDALTSENQQFLIAYSGTFIIPVTQMLIALDKAGLNTSINRQIVADFSNPLPLQRAFKYLERAELLTQEYFDLISAEENLSWLFSLEEMPEDLITAEVWQGLVKLLENSNENDFRRDFKEYAQMLKKQLNRQQRGKDALVSEVGLDNQGRPSTSTGCFFSVMPVNPPPAVAVKDAGLQMSFAPS